MLGGVVLGRSLPGLEGALDAVRAMLTGGPVPAAPFDDYEVLTPAREYKNRHASILLALDAACEAAAQSAPA